MRTVRSLAAVGSLVGLFATDALAFKPNEDGHLGITTAALEPITRTAEGETFQFSERALDEIRDANRNTDIITFFGVAEHFDDEAFDASSRRLIDVKESVIQQAVAGDGEGARRDLGGALHTVQDFYSHSNWVELGRAGIELMIEPINTRDMPGFFLNDTGQALALIEAVGAANLGLQYDIYHRQVMRGDVARDIERCLSRIGHIQIADNPGRHEPGTGELNYPFLLAHVERLGYTGWIGCEYQPKATTRQGLAWLDAYSEFRSDAEHR
jgi:sugar phosphate isomerase/epimerase